MLIAPLLAAKAANHILSANAQTVFDFAKENPLTLAEVIQRQLLPADIIAHTFAEMTDLPYVDMDKISDAQIILSLLPETLINHYHVLPFKQADHQVAIAIANLEQTQVLQEITVLIGQPLYWHVAEYDKLSRRMAQLLHHQAQDQLTEETSIVSYVEKLFTDAIHKRASDIHIEIYKATLRIRLRIDGLLYEQAQFSSTFAARLLAHLKVLAQLDMTERRLPQDGRLQMVLSPTQKVDCRINTCPTIDGEKAVLRLLNISAITLDIHQLGLHEKQQQLFLQAIHQPQGMILVTGPTGSGKTVTLYAALECLNKTEVNISSVEDPVEIELSGINQVPINYKIELTFAKVLRALLRQDPDIIMVGEMRDSETAEIAIQAAQTGHLVLSTLHTNSASETLTRLLHMGVAAYQLAASVSLIIAQRLLRILCPHCKTPDDLATKAFGFMIYRAVGCTKCQQGYHGRTAIYECLMMTPTLAHLILQRAEAIVIEKQACEEGMMTLAEHGWQKIRAGLTTPAELARVVRSVSTFHE